MFKLGIGPNLGIERRSVVQEKNALHSYPEEVRLRFGRGTFSIPKKFNSGSEEVRSNSN